MALQPLRDLRMVDLNFPCLNTSERGGILSIVTVSGMRVVEYTRNPTDGSPIGIQLNDIEWVNYGFQTLPMIRRQVGVRGELVGIGINGEFETDWIFPSGIIFSGSPAYVGPSGMLTNIPDYGGHKVGYFLGPIREDPHMVIYAGMGFYRHYQEFRTHNIVFENNPDDQVRIATPGFVKVSISEASMTL